MQHSITPYELKKTNKQRKNQPTVCFTGWHICEQQQAEVLTDREGQVHTAEWVLREPRRKTRLVKSEVGKRHQEPGSWVQSDAQPPYVGLGAEADGGADGGQVVGNLETGEDGFKSEEDI